MMGTLGKQWRVKHRWDALNDGSKQWRKNLRHVIYRASAKSKVMMRYGPECNSCGHKDQEVLQVDHIKGNGRGEHGRRQSAAFYNLVLRSPWGLFQILCANCNWKKRIADKMENQWP